jgi:hypothetical protein
MLVWGTRKRSAGIAACGHARPVTPSFCVGWQAQVAQEAVASSAAAQAEAATLREQLCSAQRAARLAQDKVNTEALRRQHAESKVSP